MALYQDEVLLRILYTTELKTSHEIACELGTNHRTILNWLNKYNVPIRSSHEPHNEFVLVYRDVEWLTTQYVDNKKSTSLIAKEIGMSQTCVFKWLKLFNIPLRSKSEAHKPKKPRAPPKACVGHPHTESSRAKIAKAHAGRPLSEDHRRRVSEGRRGKLRGHENPNWRGGLSFGNYCPKFNNALREEIRKDFGSRCYLCKTSEHENGRKLDVHHVDYNKGQGCGQKWNLVPLCQKCHTKTNHNRWYWFCLLANYWVNGAVDEWQIMQLHPHI